VTNDPGSEPIWMSTADATSWRKSSYSDGSASSDCVEVAFGAAAAVRDSKNATGPVLNFRPQAWRDFIALRAARHEP
jgi:hypothetical protein